MAKFFKALLIAVPFAFAVAEFSLPATTFALADTWDDVQLITWDAITDIGVKEYAKRGEVSGETERRRNEILQSFNFFNGNGKIAIQKCDRVFFEASEKAAINFKRQKIEEIRSQKKDIELDIPKWEAQATELEKEYKKSFRKLDELSIYDRATTGRRKGLLQLTATALVREAKARARLEIAKFEIKQLDDLLLFLRTPSRFIFPGFPKDCTVETYSNPVARQQNPLDINRHAIKGDSKHYAVDDVLNRTKIEKKIEIAKADSQHAKIDGASSAEGNHTLLDYCTISANPRFQKVCYSLWRRVCKSIPDAEKQRRCNDVLQPGGPRLADGRIWDFCAFVDRPFERWCYDGMRHVVIGACRNATSLTSGVGKACRERAANLPSNLPARAQPATKTTRRECKKGGGLVGAIDCVTSRMGDEPAKTAPQSAKERRAPTSAGSTDNKTGITTTSVKNPDGTRTVTRTDKDGNVLSKETVGKAPASASSTDNNTGITTTWSRTRTARGR